jgi:hypothetical protein
LYTDTLRLLVLLQSENGNHCNEWEGLYVKLKILIINYRKYNYELQYRTRLYDILCNGVNHFIPVVCEMSEIWGYISINTKI